MQVAVVPPMLRPEISGKQSYRGVGLPIIQICEPVLFKSFVCIRFWVVSKAIAVEPAAAEAKLEVADLAELCDSHNGIE